MICFLGWTVGTTRYMKRIRKSLILTLLIVSCSNLTLDNEPTCDCSINIYSNLPQNEDGVYELEYNENLSMTYSHLYVETECGWSKRVMWDSDTQYQLSPVDWTNLINPSSMTDEDGNGTIVFGVWEDLIGHTITYYGGYVDDCGNHFIDSVKVSVY